MEDQDAVAQPLDQLEQVGREEHGGARPRPRHDRLAHVPDGLRVEPGQGPELGLPEGIAQEPGVDDPVGLDLHAVLEAERGDRAGEPAAVGARPHQGDDPLSEGRRRQVGGVEHRLGGGAHWLQDSALGCDRRRSVARRRAGMGPQALRLAPDQHLVAGVEEEHPHPRGRHESGQGVGLAGIDDHRRRPGCAGGQRREHRQGQVVDAVQAGPLQGTQRGGLAGTAHPSDDPDRRRGRRALTHRDDSTEGRAGRHPVFRAAP